MSQGHRLSKHSTPCWREAWRQTLVRRACIAALTLALGGCLVEFGETGQAADAYFSEDAHDARMAQCGDGIAQDDEVCDGDDFRGLSCKALGMGAGSLACSEDCSLIDYSDCEQEPKCGNGTLDEGEECDDGNHSNVDGCPDDPAAGGTCHEARCGDRFVWAAHEACDSGGVDSAECDSDCTTPVCGDGHANQDAGETCDGTDFRGATCATLGFTGGTLACSAGCHAVDQSQCFLCGDGVCGPGERGSCPNDCEIVGISTGDAHTCAVHRDGSAWCWGHNQGGQLGVGTTQDSSSPVQVVFP